MRVLVTGAAGRIGSVVADQLVYHGHEVSGLDIRHWDCPYPAFVGALSDPDFVRRATQECEVIVHLGAFMSWKPEDSRQLRQANIDGTHELLMGAAESGVKRVVFASTGEVYPENSPVFLPIDEHHPLRPNTTYGLTKFVGEALVRFFGDTDAFETVILRFGHTQTSSELLDPNSDFSGPRFFLRSRLRKAHRLGLTEEMEILERHNQDDVEKLILVRDPEGRSTRMMIGDTRDIAQGVLLAVTGERAVGETIGLGPDDPVVFEKAIRDIASITGLEIEEVTLPKAVPDYVTSNAKAKEVLGFRPEWSFDRMLEDAGRSWRERHTSRVR